MNTVKTFQIKTNTDSSYFYTSSVYSSLFDFTNALCEMGPNRWLSVKDVCGIDSVITIGSIVSMQIIAELSETVTVEAKIDTKGARMEVTPVASMGLKIDSSEVRSATDDLERFTTAAKEAVRAQKQYDDLMFDSRVLAAIRKATAARQL